MQETAPESRMGCSKRPSVKKQLCSLSVLMDTVCAAFCHEDDPAVGCFTLTPCAPGVPDQEGQDGRQTCAEQAATHYIQGTGIDASIEGRNAGSNASIFEKLS